MENEIKEEKIKKSPKELTFFILKIVGNVIFYSIIIGLLLFSIANIQAGAKGQGFPNLFGKGYLTVQDTHSMELTEGTTLDNINVDGQTYRYKDFAIQQFGTNDLLMVDKFSEDKWNNLKVGDVVVFYDDSLQALNTHRIVFMRWDADGNVDSISLQGDRSAAQDGVYDPVNKILEANMLISKPNSPINTFSRDVGLDKVKGFVTSVSYGGGTPVKFIQTNWVLVCIVPVGILLLVEVFFVVKNIMDLRGAKNREELLADKEAMQAELEAQREEMRKQILAELAEQQKQKQEEEVDSFEDSPTEENKEE